MDAECEILSSAVCRRHRHLQARMAAGHSASPPKKQTEVNDAQASKDSAFELLMRRIRNRLFQHRFLDLPCIG